MITFGTKAHTLSALKNILTLSTICDAITITVKDWDKDQNKIIEAIQKKFEPYEIIVRSSALDEDTCSISMAGAYKSVIDVDSKSTEQIKNAISLVIQSYGKSCLNKNEILIQPMIQDVSMSGVIFSHDLNTGAPYYVINYDDISGKTDTVTSGTTDISRTLLIYRKQIEKIHSSRFKKLLMAVIEIESVSPYSGLDIEFAVTHNEQIYILQVRRLAVQENWNRSISNLIDHSLNQIYQFVENRFKPVHNSLGYTSVLGEMPDWNPVEMIGTVPRPLARSLYERLITDSIWAEARASMGYRDLSNHPLMLNLGGRVYIDVRESFNSYLPADLSSEIGEKLVSGWVDYLKANTSLHYKIEFEVAITAYTFDFDARVSAFPDILSKEEWKKFKHTLLKFTNNVIINQKAMIDDQLNQIELLNRKRKSLLEKQSSVNIMIIIKELLDDCALYGTKPFSILARCAFIAETFLRSMEIKNILSTESIEQFKGSIVTIISDLLESMNALMARKISKKTFMERFGHLRPGTYDILAIRYDQLDDISNINNDVKTFRSFQKKTFNLSKKQKNTINKELQAYGFEFDTETLFDFMKKVISAREYAKFIFSRNISDALELIAEWGLDIGLSRDELSFLTINQLIESIKNTFHCPYEMYYRDLSKSAKESFGISHAIRLPYLICELSDIFVVPLLKSRPNFITKNRVQAALLYVSGHEFNFHHTEDTIIYIERADPGYDWIFLNPIKGLITKYGGANSHMAIRCAELKIPAAIGCGEQMFDQLRKANTVLLDCGSRLIIPIK